MTAYAYFWCPLTFGTEGSALFSSPYTWPPCGHSNRLGPRLRCQPGAGHNVVLWANGSGAEGSADVLQACRVPRLSPAPLSRPPPRGFGTPCAVGWQAPATELAKPAGVALRVSCSERGHTEKCEDPGRGEWTATEPLAAIQTDMYSLVVWSSEIYNGSHWPQIEGS